MDCIFSLPLSAAIPAGATTAEVEVHGQSGSNFVDVSGVYDSVTRTLTASGVGAVAGFQNVTVELEMHFAENGDITGTYTMGANGELPQGQPGIYNITGNVPTPTPGPTVTPGPTAPATPAPTGTPGGGTLITFGNLDCDEDGITSRDNQALLRNVLSQAALSQTKPCPDIGNPTGVAVPAGTQQLAWGDLDCDGEISSRDNQALLRNVLTQAALSQTEPCPDIGADVIVEISL